MPASSILEEIEDALEFPDDSELPTDEELLALPRVQRCQIILEKSLGCGAFGEVFEGTVRDLIEGSSPMKIAIKTLRKGATDYEKEEFLKEAKLMSNFKHDHILQLLGVCFDNNSSFMLLELMEGRDLLTFLRFNRPSLFQPSLLTLDDLFGICVDVAQGCKYLEDMNFVHRDLAARNCLVSSVDREQRIVKIGDFGLARDIYKNDYYRKEGEGLLPVRWMAPESLVYGIFTTQSDVWAFGVLLWEVMTLGQQPYPAQTNKEVLNYVRAGGRLDKPENCLDDLHEVMIRCWCYDPEGRPSFSYCLNALQEFRHNALSSPAIISAVQNENYLCRSISGFENLGYSGDELIDLFEPLPIEEEEEEETVPPGAYILANDGVNNGRTKDDIEQEADTFSIQSDPVRSNGMYTSEIQAVKRSASLNYPLGDCETSGHPTRVPNGVRACGHTNGFRFSQNYNKYLELLADHKDMDGYEIPIRALISDISSDAHSALKHSRCSNCPTGYSQENNIPGVKCAKMLKPMLAPFYAQVFSGSSISPDANKSLLPNGFNFSHDMPKDFEPSSESSLTKGHFEGSHVSRDLFTSSDPISIDNECDSFDSKTCAENDQWSLSTTSTVPCDLYFPPTSQRNSAASTMSSGTEINLNHISTSSWC